MKMLRLVPLLFAITGLGVLAPAVRAQSTVDSSTSASITGDSRSPTIKHPQPDLVYRCPTEKAKLRTYFFDVFSPYPIAGVAMVAALNQAEGTPLNSSMENSTPYLTYFFVRHFRERKPPAPRTAEDKL
jgi:hypothetical protein